MHRRLELTCQPTHTPPRSNRLPKLRKDIQEALPDEPEIKEPATPKPRKRKSITEGDESEKGSSKSPKKERTPKSKGGKKDAEVKAEEEEE